MTFEEAAAVLGPDATRELVEQARTWPPLTQEQITLLTAILTDDDTPPLRHADAA